MGRPRPDRGRPPHAQNQRTTKSATNHAHVPDHDTTQPMERQEDRTTRACIGCVSGMANNHACGREGERIRKLTTQRACHRGSNIKGAEWDAHGRIAAGLPTSRINARQNQPQTTPMHQTTTPPNQWRDKVWGSEPKYAAQRDNQNDEDEGNGRVKRE